LETKEHFFNFSPAQCSHLPGKRRNGDRLGLGEVVAFWVLSQGGFDDIEGG
jgi:hypothetical protein